MLPFLRRLPLKQVATVCQEAGARPRQVLEGLFQGLPELLMACVVEVQSGKLRAFYTLSKAYNPHHICVREAKLLGTMQQAHANQLPAGGSLIEVTVVLDEELHHIRLLHASQWYCYVAVRTADANLALTREVVRRCAF